MRLELCLGSIEKKGEVIFKWFPDFKTKMENYFGEWKSEPPKIVPIKLQDNLLCPVRAFKLYLKKRPAVKPDNPYRVWFVMKSELFCLVRDTIKESFNFDPRSQARGFDANTHVKCHDLRKFACSYSRKYVYRTSKSLAQRLGSRPFTT